MKEVAEYFQVDKAQFWQTIVPAQQPVILRQAVNHWPSVAAARASDAQLQAYFAHFDNRTEVNTILAHPDTKGRLTYNDSLTGFNFERQKAPVTAVLNELRRIADKPDALHIAVQSARTDACLPGFSSSNSMPLLDTEIVPRIWAGNKITVPAHFDDADNLACVVAGNRRFTLFPPAQAANLYIGPLDFTPAGAPVSLVDITAPDLVKFPRYQAAMEQAQVAELEPGDVLYIPTLWWHHVESLSAVNILINYWWGGSLADNASRASPFDSLLHTLMTIKQLPEHQRQHWQALFNHFAFHDGASPVAHLADTCDSVQGKLTAERKQKIIDWLSSQMQHL